MSGKEDMVGLAAAFYFFGIIFFSFLFLLCFRFVNCCWDLRKCHVLEWEGFTFAFVCHFLTLRWRCFCVNNDTFMSFIEVLKRAKRRKEEMLCVSFKWVIKE